VSPNGGEVISDNHTIRWEAATDNEQIESELVYEIDYASNASVADEAQSFDLIKANGQLQSDEVNDVFVYDTTKDSDGGAWRNGRLSKLGSDALSFDGVNDYIGMGKQLQLSNQNIFTAVVWAKLPPTLPPNSKIIMQIQGSQMGGNSNSAAINISSNGVFIGWYAGGNSGDPDCTHCWRLFDSSVPLDRWVQIAGVWDSNGDTVTSSLYINGTLRNTATSGLLTFIGFNAYPIIGGSSWGLTYTDSYFSGIVDEVAIYDRALSAAEIKDLYNSGMGRELVPDASTVGLWRFNEGSGSTAIDASDNGNDGTIYGATYVGKASWYDEPPSETRGARREFPDKAHFVATDAGLDIIDSSDNSLWMRFSAVAGSQFPVGPKKIFALNGKIYLATSEGLYIIDFVNDKSLRYDTTGLAFSDRPIADRHEMNIYAIKDTEIPLIDSATNDVHSAVINGKTYIAVATDAGVSVIDEGDKTIVSMPEPNASYVADDVYVLDNGDFYLNLHASGNYVVTYAYYDITSLTDGVEMTSQSDYSYWPQDNWFPIPTSGGFATIPGLPKEIFVVPGTSTANEGDNTIYVANDAEITVIQEWQGNEENGSAVHFGSADSINDDIDYRILAGDTDRCSSIAVSGNTMWVGTNDEAWGGAVSQVDLAINSLIASYAMDSSPSIVSNNVTSLAGNARNLLVGTDSGATALKGEPFWQNIVSVSDGITTSGGIGSYEWDTSSLPEGTDYKIRIRAYDGVDYGPYDESDGTFEIYHDTLSYGLVGYYPFSGNADDESGNGNDGTVYGANLTTDRFGVEDSAYSFDGVADWIRVEDSVSLDISDELTLSAWIYGESFEGIDTIVHKFSAYGLHYNHIAFQGQGAENAVNLILNSGGWNLFNHPFQPEINVWYNITATYDGSYVRNYLNGNLEEDFEYDQPIQTSSGSLAFIIIGGWVDPADPNRDQFFHGVIDDIRIYNRALSDAEINLLYTDK